jgi:hypothetical protein
VRREASDIVEDPPRSRRLTPARALSDAGRSERLATVSAEKRVGEEVGEVADPREQEGIEVVSPPHVELGGELTEIGEGPALSWPQLEQASTREVFPYTAHRPATAGSAVGRRRRRRQARSHRAKLRDGFCRTYSRTRIGDTCTDP